MREIKFRGYHKNLKEMVDITAIHFTDGEMSHISIKPITRVSSNTLLLNADEIELMQFTGLKDKNGKEIYEGDILIDDEYPDEGIGYAEVKWGNGWYASPWFDEKEFAKEAENYQIIGNSFENPELLSNPKAHERNTL